MRWFLGLALGASCLRKNGVLPVPYMEAQFDQSDFEHVLLRQNQSVLRHFLDGSEAEVEEETNREPFCYLKTLQDIGDPDFTDGAFRCLMLRKCGIPDRKFDNLKLYYDLNGIEYENGENKCFEQLKQFQKDLKDGEFHAQQMCDSWGEDIDFRNWPGLQFQVGISESNAPFYWRIEFELILNHKLLVSSVEIELTIRKYSPGHYNQCKQVHRRDSLTGESLYKGQYVLTEPLIHGLKEKVPTVTSLAPGYLEPTV